MMNENVNPNEAKKEPVMEEDKSQTKEKPLVMPSKMQTDILAYFNNLPLPRQLELLEQHGIDFTKILEGVTTHRKDALTDRKKASEKMKAAKTSNKPAALRGLIELRYVEDIKFWAGEGHSAVAMSAQITETECSVNYPKRRKGWRLSPAIVKAIMKDNGIEIKKN